MSGEFRVGVGYDSHRLTENRRLILGGVEIPFDKGLDGHSDGDILLHSLTDALLGAAGLGDIGEHFPPSDPRWKDADSRIFLRHAADLVRQRGYRIVNVDVTLVLEAPKIGPYREQIRKSVAETLDVEPDRVGLKAKTAEGLGPVGRGESAEAHAVASLAK
jgi:2-C-methyl-D-erythritol 2,4-cyclodiphosphate synthase